MPTTKIFFITDIHGSTICFKKFINTIHSKLSPDILIIGGDITAKDPVCIFKKNGRWVYNFEGTTNTLNSQEQIQQHLKLLADKGIYGFVGVEEDAARLNCDSDKFDEAYRSEIMMKLASERIREWMHYAESHLKNKNKKLIINCGNDDPFYIDDVLDEFPDIVIRPEGKIIPLDDYLLLVSTGFSNETPWLCPRDFKKTEDNLKKDEEDLKFKIDKMMHDVPVEKWKSCIFNFHCPPRDTLLDLAPKIDKKTLKPILTGFGQEFENVGSSAVKDTILLYKPLIGLHGHIHEQSHEEVVGKTLCINPGSEYQQGILHGVYLEFNQGQLVKHQLMTDYFDTQSWRLISLDRRILFDMLSHIPLIGGIFKAKIEHETEEKIAQQFEYNDKSRSENEKQIENINQRMNRIEKTLNEVKEIISKNNLQK
jgi:Icc-related predicted phosphoesterase